MGNQSIQEVDGGVVFAAKIVPASSKTGISGFIDGLVKIKISAAPEKGKANKCLLEFLAKQLGVKKNAVSIISGKTSAVKSVRVVGISAEQLSNKLDLSKQSVGQ